MSYDTVMWISNALGIAERLGSALMLGSCLIWLTGFYILFQMFRLRFLKVLMLAEVLSIVQWAWSQRFLMFGGGFRLPGSSNIAVSLAYSWMDFLIRSAPTVAYLVGGILALRYLQRRWKEQIANKRIDDTAVEHRRSSFRTLDIGNEMKKKQVIVAIVLAALVALGYMIGFRKGRSAGQREAFRSAAAFELHTSMRTIELPESGHTSHAIDAERKLAWVSIIGAHEFRNSKPLDDRRHMNTLLAKTADHFATNPLHNARQPSPEPDLVAAVGSNATLSSTGESALKQMEKVVMTLEEIGKTRNQLTQDTLDEYLQDK